MEINTADACVCFCENFCYLYSGDSENCGDFERKRKKTGYFNMNFSLFKYGYYSIAFVFSV